MSPSRNLKSISRRTGVALMLAAPLVIGVRLTTAAEHGRAIPTPAVDEKAIDAPTAVAVIAGGCFWGVQGVFQRVEGVINAVSGYAGGEEETAKYHTVGSGDTGHAEAVQITYDPGKISYGRLLQIYFSVAHNPTQLNYQGPDNGPQYRSAIFPLDEEQAAVAKAYIDQLNQARAFRSPVVTTIEPGKTFYPAEAYHQNYLTLYPHEPYIAIHDLPKIAELKKFFPELYRAKPVLVKTSKKTSG